MRRNGNLLVFIVRGWHPERKPAVINQHFCGEIEYVIQHGYKTVWFLWWNEFRVSGLRQLKVYVKQRDDTPLPIH